MPNKIVPPEILRKIRRCFAYTQSNFEGEASAALAAAERLMTQYGLSRAEIDLDADGKIKEGGIIEIKSKPKAIRRWEQILAKSCTYLLPIEVLASSIGKRTILSFFGTESDAELGMEFFKILRKEILSISLNEADRNNFLLGCAVGILRRAYERREELTRQSADQHVQKNSGTDLMLNKSAQLRTFLEETYHIRQPKNIVRVGGEAYRRGQRASENINLNLQNTIE